MSGTPEQIVNNIWAMLGAMKETGLSFDKSFSVNVQYLAEQGRVVMQVYGKPFMENGRVTLPLIAGFSRAVSSFSSATALRVAVLETMERAFYQAFLDGAFGAWRSTTTLEALTATARGLWAKGGDLVSRMMPLLTFDLGLFSTPESELDYARQGF